MKDKILKEIEWLENQIDKLYANGHDTTYFEKLIDRRIEHLEIIEKYNALKFSNFWHER